MPFVKDDPRINRMGAPKKKSNEKIRLNINKFVEDHFDKYTEEMLALKGREFVSAFNYLFQYILTSYGKLVPSGDIQDGSDTNPNETERYKKVAKAVREMLKPGKAA